jgi:hypothetical protein
MVLVLHRVSIRRLFQRPFTADTLDSNTQGNVFAATAFLQGVRLRKSIGASSTSTIGLIL